MTLSRPGVLAARRPRATAIWLLAGVSLAASLGYLVVRLAGPSDGAVIAFYSDAWTLDGVRVEPLDQPPDGLMAGDIVTHVAGRPLGELLDRAVDPELDRSGFDGSRTVRYTVSRAGAVTDVLLELRPRDIGSVLRDNWSVLVFTVFLQVVAAYVLWRRPEASAATALMIVACGVTGSTLPWLLGLQPSDIAQGWPFLLYAATAGGIYMLLWPAGALHLPLALAAGPTGPSRARLALVYGIPLGAYVGGLGVTRVLAPSPTAWLGTWPEVQGLVIVPAIVGWLVLGVRGYRAAQPVVRKQMRWAMLGGVAATIPSAVLLFGPELVTGRPLIPWSAVGLLALPMPIGIAMAILRDRLFDIDVAVNRALVYGGASLALVLIYAVSVSVIGSLLPLEGGFPASLLATGLAAVVALPIRDSLQAAVNRLMFGDRDDPYRALTRLGQRLESTLDPVEAPTVIVRTVAESLRLPWVALRFGPAGADRTIAHGRRPLGEPIGVPLMYGAEVIGDLLVAPHSSSEPLSVADWTLLEALARQAGVAVHAVSLTLDLIDSRERLVAAREEERRRIRRDLHDGLGPTLAAIGMRAEVAADLAAHDPAASARVLGELREDVHDALADIRRLVDALRPPALDELGLVGSLRAQAERLGGPRLDIAGIGELPVLPAAVEVAAYRIVSEAMTNAARHSGASTCTVRISAPPVGSEDVPALELEIVDDGRGLPATGIRPGIGLGSMRERAAEVGGTCRIEAMPAGGTRVIARLPLDGATAAPS
ncbi:MAG TPA: GAF domain-containing sensor histidine kinase [Candidatus Limnocylindria bacterium]|nr:GAF domain-containing sensor histidine kinase [Candidatus Limnocylindria bacterium]